MKASICLVMAGVMLLDACAGPGPERRWTYSGLRELRPHPGRAILQGKRSPQLLASIGEWIPELEGALLDPPTDEEKEAERDSAIAQMWGIASPINRIDAEVEVTFWTSWGALTMVKWKRTVDGKMPCGFADSGAFDRVLRGSLKEYVGEQPRYLRFVLRRIQTGWTLLGVEATRAEAGAPVAAKLLPVNQREVRVETYASVNESSKALRAALRIPFPGSARAAWAVDFEDDRVTGSTLEGVWSAGPNSSRGVDPQFEGEVDGALLPFARGVGRRTVRLKVRTVDFPAIPFPRWQVEEVLTLRSLSDEPSEYSFTEYRIMHERILRQWREGIRNEAEAAAIFTAEETALWIAGGWALHGLGMVCKGMTLRVLRMFSRSVPELAPWLRTLLTRLPAAEREAFVRLITQAEKGTLGGPGKAQLRALMGRIEQIAQTPIPKEIKEDIRTLARERYWGTLRKTDRKLADKMVNAKGLAYPVHHRTGLEYAHLFVEEDINAMSNLAALESEVHKAVNGVWTTYRSSGRVATDAEVRQIVAIVDRNFGHWYNKVVDPIASKSMVTKAAQNALRELQILMK